MPISRAFEMASVSILLNKIASKDTIDFLLKWNIDKPLLKKLETSLLAIQAVSNDAERKQMGDALVKAWLEEVNDASYDAEDLLDEISTDMIESSGKVRNKIDDVLHVSTTFKSAIDWKLKEVASALDPSKETVETRMRDLIERLEDLRGKQEILGLKKNEGKGFDMDDERLTTGVEISEVSHVYGRDLDKREILRLLKWKEGDDKRVGVLSIVGMGGIGKTTLAQMVYHDEVELKKEQFDLKAWACVMDKFDVKQITKTLIESATESSCSVDSLELLQARLKKLLQDKKFLLVLDDVWNEKYSNWEQLKIPFSVGKPGSRIIVTTRDKEVANLMCTTPVYYLKELSVDDSWSLFERIVFPDKNSSAFPELIDIGKDILKKCRGLPLAAKALGGLLLSQGFDKIKWTFILNSELWDLPNIDILPALWLSYDHLPMQVKACFVYCSIFPKGYEFHVEELVLLWMAEDLLEEPADGNNRLEDVGRMYFSLLHSRSFLQPRSTNESVFLMHDLVHDLSHFISGKICLQLENPLNRGNANEKCRRISHYHGTNDVFSKFEPVRGLKHLRTFLTLSPLLRFDFEYLSSKVLLDLLPKFKKLRVLYLCGYLIDELPDSISCLKHLRYLNLSYSDIRCLPDAVTNLYNLQILTLSFCRSLTKLPKNLGSLTRLRHIYTDHTNLYEMPLGMGRLSCLQTLSNFVVGEGDGSGLGELKDLQYLRGKLTISGLLNVVSEMDAGDAMLSQKIYLDELVLEWNSRVSRNLNLEELIFYNFIFDELEPHVSLRKLKISYFAGSEFPHWLGSSLFHGLVFLHINKCANCHTLPSLGQLPSLIDLIIEGLDSITSVSDELCGEYHNCVPFPSLRTLKVQKMKNLDVVSFLGLDKGFPLVEELRILDCPELLKFSYCFPSLRKLQIERCDKLVAFWKPCTEAESDYYQFLRFLTLVGCPLVDEVPKNVLRLETLYLDGCDNLLTVPHFSELRLLDLYDSQSQLLNNMTSLGSLRYVELNNIHLMAELPEAFVLQCKKLEELKILNCQDLVHMLSKEYGISGFAFLRCITISGCSKFNALPDEIAKFSPSLESLHLKNCDGFMKLPSELWKLTSLYELTLVKCKNFDLFPVEGMPSTLKRLIIQECGALRTCPERMLRNCSSLELMKIERCGELISIIENGELPTNLKQITVGSCKSLLSLPTALVLQPRMKLEILEISDCDLITSFPDGDLPATLKRLSISGCDKLMSLPNIYKLNSLESLEVLSCPLIEQFPIIGLPNSSLQALKITYCKNFKCLPSNFGRLTCLRELEITGCPNLVYKHKLPLQLRTLYIDECKELNLVPEAHKLRRLEKLSICRISGLVSFSLQDLLSYSIMELTFAELPDLEWLPQSLYKLVKLRVLYILNCAKLLSLPKDGLPSTVASLKIAGCPLVTPSCKPGSGDYWSKISGIPHVDIS